MIRKFLNILTLFFVSNIFSFPAGSLDTTFDGDGIAFVLIDTLSQANALAIQPDQKIVPAGWAGESIGRRQFALARLNSDGSLDTIFGTNGIVTTSIIPNQPSQAFDVKIDSNLKIVAAGVSGISVAQQRFALARFNTDGSLDSTFGTNGVVSTDVSGGNSEQANGLAIQSDGKLVAVGFSTSAGVQRFSLVRYNSNGSLDSSFGTGGIVITDVATGNDRANDVVIQPDGKIVVVGLAGNNSGAVVRYNTDGSLDGTFGAGGIRTILFLGGTTTQFDAVTLQPDGKIVIIGTTNAIGTNHFAIVRLNSDGTFDTSFGNGAGFVIVDAGGIDMGTGIGIQNDGRIVFGGFSTVGLLTLFVVGRLNKDGSLDTTFGNNGIVTTQIQTTALANDLALQKNGKIVLAGYSTASPDIFTLARYTVCPGIEFQGAIAAAIAEKYSL
ncbi:delta-60 repeat domain-containing protein [Candidatus Dependentiae bacterium]|nr:delta-60 repeat domain-containing protein [Candidatus Dependentiae bacterium]